MAILGFGARTVPSGDPGTSASAIISEYKQHASAISLAAGWYSLVLLGRILFVAGLRDALRRSGCRTALADFALVAMAVSVVLEIAAFAIAAGAAHAASTGSEHSTIVGLDAVANWLDLNIVAPVGASVLAVSLAMLRSRVVPVWLCRLGLAVGAAGCVAGVINGPGVPARWSPLPGNQCGYDSGRDCLLVWMLVTGIRLFRSVGRGAHERAPAATDEIG